MSQLPPYPLCKPPIQSLCFQLVQEETVGNSYLELGQVSSRQDSKVFKSRTGSCLSSASSSQPHSMSLPICLVPVCQRGWEQQDGAWQPFSICVCCSVLVLEVGQEVQWPWMPLVSVPMHRPILGRILGDLSKSVGGTTSLQSWKGGLCTPVCESSLKEGRGSRE